MSIKRNRLKLNDRKYRARQYNATWVSGDNTEERYAMKDRKYRGRQYNAMWVSGENTEERYTG